MFKIQRSGLETTGVRKRAYEKIKQNFVYDFIVYEVEILYMIIFPFLPESW